MNPYSTPKTIGMVISAIGLVLILPICVRGIMGLTYNFERDYTYLVMYIIPLVPIGFTVWWTYMVHKKEKNYVDPLLKL